MGEGIQWSLLMNKQKIQQLRTGNEILKMQHENGDNKVCNHHKNLGIIFDRTETKNKDISKQQ